MNRRSDLKNSADTAVKDRVSFSNSIHTNFLQQMEKLLVDSELSDAAREKILANLSCPCCGGNAAAFTIKLGEED